MRRLAPVLLVLTGCASHHAQPPVSGPPTTDAPEVRPMVESRVPYQPAPTTTVAPPTTHTHPTAPAVVAAAATPPVVQSGECGGWRDHVAVAFPGEVGTACRILMCESKGNPSAVSSTADYGLLQVNEPTWNKPGHHDPVADWIGRHWHSVYDPATNLEMARRIRATYGWGMWACA